MRGGAGGGSDGGEHECPQRPGRQHKGVNGARKEKLVALENNTLPAKTLKFKLQKNILLTKQYTSAGHI